MNRIHPSARRNKSVDPQLNVHAWTAKGFLHAGVLDLEEDGDREMRAKFSYTAAYLKHPDAFPLDPINLPLVKGARETDTPLEVLGAIFDAAPDAWGRKVATASLSVAEQAKIYRNTFLRGADGIGALVMTPAGVLLNLDEIVKWSLNERPALSQLSVAAQAAHELESTGEVPEEMRDMLAGSWTIGGARPKALLRDDRPNAGPGESVIAKFSSTRDVIDRNRMEWVGLELAQRMGMEVPAHWITDLGHGQNAIVLERFDRQRWPSLSNGLPVRRHYLSAMSLVSKRSLSPFLDTPSDRAVFSWGKLLDVTSRVAKDPAQAKVTMFARLVLNAALSNTDDHLKNFGFLRSLDDPLHYEIAPVFDISPQSSERHYLHHPVFGQFQTAEGVLAEHKALGISSKAAAEVRDALCDAFSLRESIFDDAGLNRSDRERANTWIERGLGEGLATMTAKDTASNRPSPA